MKRALLVGINKYESIGNLNGCVNDVDDVHSLLIDQFGFNDHVMRVLNEHATADGITTALTDLVEISKPGDTLFSAGDTSSKAGGHLIQSRGTPHFDGLNGTDHAAHAGSDELELMWAMYSSRKTFSVDLTGLMAVVPSAQRDASSIVSARFSPHFYKI